MNRLSSQHHMSTYAERRKRIPDLCVYVLGDGSPLTECGWRKIAVCLQIHTDVCMSNVQIVYHLSLETNFAAADENNFFRIRFAQQKKINQLSSYVVGMAEALYYYIT